MTADVTITNVSGSSLHLILEPWANEHDLPAEGRMSMTLKGPDKADIEIEVGAAALTVWGWVGSTLDDHINPPGPPVPPTPGSSASPGERKGPGHGLEPQRGDLTPALMRNAVAAEITIANASDSSLHLILEPWAREQNVPPGGRTKITLVGPDKAAIEIEVRAAALDVWGWVGSTLDDHINPPGPPVPPTPGSDYIA